MPITSFTNDSLTFGVTDSGPADGVPIDAVARIPATRQLVGPGHPLLQSADTARSPPISGYSPAHAPKGRKAVCTMPHLAADVAALIDEIGSPVHLVGHDWGAGVAWPVTGQLPGQDQDHDRGVGRPSQGVHPARWFAATGAALLVHARLPVPQTARTRDVLRQRQATAAMAQFGMTPVMVEQFHNNIVDDGALTGGLAGTAGCRSPRPATWAGYRRRRPWCGRRRYGPQHASGRRLGPLRRRPVHLRPRRRGVALDPEERRAN